MAIHTDMLVIKSKHFIIIIIIIIYIYIFRIIATSINNSFPYWINTICVVCRIILILKVGHYTMHRHVNNPTTKATKMWIGSLFIS